jgi:hypothetical protein
MKHPSTLRFKQCTDHFLIEREKHNMKHPSTLRLRCLAAIAIAAVAPLAAQAQAQTQTSTLTIEVGPEPVVEPTVSCANPGPGTLIPLAYGGAADRAGQLVLLTTDDSEAGIPSGLYKQVSAGTNGVNPKLTVGWTYGSTTSTKFVRLEATLPMNTIQSTIAGAKTDDSTAYANPTSIGTAVGSSSHVYLTGLPTSDAQQVITQTWSGDKLTVDIKKGGTADGIIKAFTNTDLALDITLRAGDNVRLKQATAATADISWTCSTVSY